MRRMTRRTKFTRLLTILLSFSGGAYLPAIAQTTEAEIRSTFPLSLHATGAGMERWYSRENGGVERITGIPYGELACSGCHDRGCEGCHGPGLDSASVSASADRANEAKARFSPPESQEVCLECHFVIDNEVRYVQENPGRGDVHFASGMECMDCHISREIHGDGNRYPSFQADGALEVRCRTCHTPPDTRSHSVHGDGVACTTCHVRSVPTCYNCHFGESGSGPPIEMDGFVFLLNQHGRVTTANLHTFISGNRTMITFAPFFPHTVMRKGRPCAECHGTAAARAVQAGAYTPVVMEEQVLEWRPGVIPISSGVEWGFPFFFYEDSVRVLLDALEEPITNYAGFGTPLTPDQILRLARLGGSDSTGSDSRPEHPGGF